MSTVLGDGGKNQPSAEALSSCVERAMIYIPSNLYIHHGLQIDQIIALCASYIDEVLPHNKIASAVLYPDFTGFAASPGL